MELNEPRVSFVLDLDITELTNVQNHEYVKITPTDAINALFKADRALSSNLNTTSQEGSMLRFDSRQKNGS